MAVCDCLWLFVAVCGCLWLCVAVCGCLCKFVGVRGSLRPLEPRPIIPPEMGGTMGPSYLLRRAEVSEGKLR